MGVMDFLKGLFSSNTEDQSVSNINITEAGSSESTPEEPQAPETSQEVSEPPVVQESGENMGGADDSNIQE